MSPESVANPSPSGPKTIGINVTDADNNVLRGAEIDVIIDGIHAASIHSSGKSQIELGPGKKTIELSVRLGSQHQHAKLGPNQDSVIFVFHGQPYRQALAKPPGGRCPDGTTGQPCVICQIAGEPIKVCG